MALEILGKVTRVKLIAPTHTLFTPIWVRLRLFSYLFNLGADQGIPFCIAPILSLDIRTVTNLH